MFKNAARRGQNTKKWQHGANAEDFSERSEDHQNRQEAKLPTPPRTDVAPKTFYELSG
jgi:hypothetical protein